MASTMAIVSGRILRPDGTVTQGGIQVEQGRISSLLPIHSPLSALFTPGVAEQLQWHAHGLLVLPGLVDVMQAPLRLAAPSTPPDSSLEPEIAHFVALDAAATQAGITSRLYLVDDLLQDSSHRQAHRWIEAFQACQSQLRARSALHLAVPYGEHAPPLSVREWTDNKTIAMLSFATASPHNAPPVPPEWFTLLASMAIARGVVLAGWRVATPHFWRLLHEHGASVCCSPQQDGVARLARTLGSTVVVGSEKPWAWASTRPEGVLPFAGCAPLSPLRAISDGLATVLGSAEDAADELPRAAFDLSAQGLAYFSDAWGVMSSLAAHALGLHDRGALTPNSWADMVLVNPPQAPQKTPQVVATFISGECLHYSPDALPPGVQPIPLYPRLRLLS